MKLADPRWVTARLSLGGAVVALLVSLGMFAPGDLRVKLLMGVLLLTLASLVAAALWGNRSTYQAAGVCTLATFVFLFSGSFAETESLTDLILAAASGVGLILTSLPRAPRAPADPPPTAAAQ